MGVSSADVVVLTDAQRQELAKLVRAGGTAQRLVLRARIVLMAAAGESNTAIAAGVASCVDTVRKWRHRWAASPGTASLGDAKRSGRPQRFNPVQVALVKALACTPPAEAAVPISRWSCPELARQAVTGGICASLSAPTVRRWLSDLTRATFADLDEAEPVCAGQGGCAVAR